MAESKEMLLDVKVDLKDVKTDNLLKVRYQCFSFCLFLFIFNASQIQQNL